MDALLPNGYRLDSEQWLVPILALALLVIAPSAVGYLRRPSWWSTVALLLKTAAVCAVAFCVLQPTRRTERPTPGANLLALVVDNSQSMQIQPSGDANSRFERIADSLDASAPWQVRLGQDFDLRRYAFDRSVRSLDDFASLLAEGTGSNLSNAISTIQNRFASRPVGGMLLFSDGISADGITTLPPPEFPIYPVVDDALLAVQDIVLTAGSATVSSFELAPAALEATIRAYGLTGRSIVTRLFDETGQPRQSETVQVDTDDFTKKVRFRYRPERTGTTFVTLRAALESDDTDSLELESRTEATTRNNSQQLAVTRTPGPYRVLYVAGRPNWEFKFLRRAIEGDVEIKLDALIRIAKEEPKFSFRDTAIQESNPLVAGFSDDEETAERYDEAMLLVIGGRDEELEPGFPSAAEDLYLYDAIILDDIEAAFFTAPQQLLLRDFVADRGGALMMLGGVDTFTRGGWENTPVGQMLPVYLDGPSSDGAAGGLRGPGEFFEEDDAKFELTRTGKLQPWLRLREDNAADSARSQLVPEISTFSELARTKPGATTFATLRHSGRELPGLVGQRFGKGKSIALSVGDFWRWSMRREKSEEDDLAQLWRQITRYVTNDTPRRLSAQVEPPAALSDPHRIVVTTLGPAFRPSGNAQVKVDVEDPSGKMLTLEALPDSEVLGRYFVEYWSTIDGGYRATVSATAADGEVLDPTECGWTAQASAAEFVQVAENRSLLTELAERSGGQLVPVSELEDFASSLPTKKVPISQVRWEPLWHQPWWLGIAICCLCVEWGLRRWKGLA